MCVWWGDGQGGGEGGVRRYKELPYAQLHGKGSQKFDSLCYVHTTMRVRLVVSMHDQS